MLWELIKMCDTYEDRCKGCGIKIPIHIGDFSTGRNNVRVWCPNCHELFWDYMKGTIDFFGPCIVSTEEWEPYVPEEGEEDHLPEECKYKGGPKIPLGVYIFVVDYPRDISINAINGLG